MFNNICTKELEVNYPRLKSEVSTRGLIMSIKKLAAELEKEINKKMDEFSNTGKKAKELQKKIDRTYIEMANIAKELKPVEYIVRQQYPEYHELFDKLLIFKKESNGK